MWAGGQARRFENTGITEDSKKEKKRVTKKKKEQKSKRKNKKKANLSVCNKSSISPGGAPNDPFATPTGAGATTTDEVGGGSTTTGVGGVTLIDR
jgi:hypothetical protein